jgi:nucleoside-diphosphate-sugar epimerase
VANILVTGGSGFLGALLVRKLLDDGHHVASVDLLPGAIEHPRLAATVTDIRDRARLDAVFAASRPEVVFHCAALLAHEVSSEAELWSSNVEGTRTLADATAAAGVRKLVYLSSNCLWGTGFDRPVTEDEPPAPVELYGESKWEGEKILLARAEFATTVIRCPTIIEEGRLGLLAILFEFIADNRRVWTVGGGGNRYQFIYAFDLIDAMLRAWAAPAGGVYGIGSDSVTTMRETFAHVIAESGSRSRIGSLPKLPTIAAMKIAHHLRLSPLGPYHYRMIASDFLFDTSRIKAELGWRPTLTNRDMLLRAYRYYASNRAEIAGRTNVSAHNQSAKMGAIRVLKWLS